VATDLAPAHLEALRQDVRAEMLQRIAQRDRYSVQLTLALGAIVGIGFSSPSDSIVSVLIAAPLVSIYFTTLILYSYRVHRVLAQYLLDEVEPKLAQAVGVDRGLEWETYYARHRVPGIRRTFFISALWVTCVGAPAYLWAVNPSSELSIALSVLTTVYLAAAAWITVTFWRH
jgi:hypothetical protein